MICTRMQEMVKISVASKGQWAVWISFDKQLYYTIHKDLKEPRDDWPADAQKYLSQAVPAGEPCVWVWVDGHCLFHFPNEEEARAFFKRVPEGSLVNAELYNPDGEQEDDNT